jgi:hypothetical protein
VGAGQRESCLGVVKLRARPVVHGVARLAVGGESQRRVVGVGGVGEIGLVARNASGGKSDELSAGRAFVA